MHVAQTKKTKIEVGKSMMLAVEMTRRAAETVLPRLAHVPFLEQKMTGETVVGDSLRGQRNVLVLLTYLGGQQVTGQCLVNHVNGQWNAGSVTVYFSPTKPSGTFHFEIQENQLVLTHRS